MSNFPRRLIVLVTIFAMIISVVPASAQELTTDDQVTEEEAAEEDVAEETVTVYALTGDAGVSAGIAAAALNLEGVVSASSTIQGLEFPEMVEIEMVGADNEAVAARLSTALGVIVAPGNSQMEITDDFAIEELEVAADPRQGEQWALKNPETEGGVGVGGAWKRTKGGGVVVAVADTGIARKHPDIEGTLWRNPGETPGNGRDDDNNGFVDDVIGWDFVEDDNNPQETIGHGTAVSSLIAAPQNGVGISGVAPRARLMTLRVCPDRSCSMQAVIYATIYAGQNGADVLNLSLSGAYQNGHPDVEVIRNVMRRVQEEHGL
ncbi:MAG: S8 family serine peptidase, partial [Actinobacteria bacterium]|nr:S8 family serine peptidase [Actinomycetota bacterium]